MVTVRRRSPWLQRTCSVVRNTESISQEDRGAAQVPCALSVSGRPASLKIENWPDCALPAAEALCLPKTATSSKAIQSFPWFSGLGQGFRRLCDSRVARPCFACCPPRNSVRPFQQLSLVIKGNDCSLSPGRPQLRFQATSLTPPEPLPFRDLHLCLGGWAATLRALYLGHPYNCLLFF